ncbi:hypothetical protein [Rhizobium sp. Leaf383]|uniref:hypothetical protein n=1 Tax=Rhizobium sp. Leaf383 TaxID=1736357 RepID=UPI00071345E7|nr:hypothetical protein [Rhizobium sp. Leaf383]KQS84260.1 hypothetical protein ASG58_21050 [Rhizobium sp. Leaf383]
MQKILAETTGEFALIDLSVGQHIAPHRPSVVLMTDFVIARTTLNQIAKIAELPDEAADADFEGFWLESGDRDLAISSFLSTFEQEDAPAAKRKGR